MMWRDDKDEIKSWNPPTSPHHTHTIFNIISIILIVLLLIITGEREGEVSGCD